MNLLTSLIELRSKEHPDEHAFRFLEDGENETDTLTWQSFHQREASVASYLQAVCQVNDRVVLMLPPCLNFVVAIAACLRSGIIAVPTNSPQPGGRSWETVLKIIQDCEPSIILTTANQSRRINDALQNDNINCRVTVLVINDFFNAPSPAVPREGTNLALLQYTSGSTGLPKGVMISIDNLISNLHIISCRFNCVPEGMGVIWLPPYHDMGLLGGILQPFYSGIPVILMPPITVIQQPIRWLRAIERYRGTIAGGPNFIYEQCLERISDSELDSLDLSSWCNAFSGSEPIRGEILKRFVERFSICGFQRQAIYPCYGLAESKLFVSGPVASGSGMKVSNFDAKAIAQRKATLLHDSGEHAITLVSNGIQADGHEVLICDPDTTEPMSPGCIGEIWVRGASVAQGYWDKPSATESNFKAYTKEGTGPYLRTGDLGFLLDGELYVSGRLKDLLIIRGQNYYPQDIKETCHTSDQALVSGGAAVTADEQGILVVQEIRREYLAKCNTDELLRKIRLNITKHHQISVDQIILTKPGSLLRTSSGKLRRSAILESCRAAEISPVAEWKTMRGSSSAQISSVPTQNSMEAWFQSWMYRESGDSLPDGDLAGIRIDDLGLDSLQQATLIADISVYINASVPTDLLTRYEYLGSFLSEVDALYKFAEGFAKLSPELRERLYKKMDEHGNSISYQDFETIPTNYYKIDQLDGIKELETRQAQLNGISPPFSLLMRESMVL